MTLLHRVEFKLTMPGRPSWDNGWSGNGVVVRELSDADVAELFDPASEAPAIVDSVERVAELTTRQRIWTHGWSDGRIAMVTARVVPLGEEPAESDGFNGYEWMIENILRTGRLFACTGCGASLLNANEACDRHAAEVVAACERIEANTARLNVETAQIEAKIAAIHRRRGTWMARTLKSEPN